MVRERLQEMTKKAQVYFMQRGNAAIKQALQLAKKQGYITLLIPDQGGWLTYRQYGEDLGFAIKELKTDHGRIVPEMVVGDKKTVLLLNSMPAYACAIDVVAIAKTCQEQGIFLINDVAASIGTGAEAHGDIIVGSFGKWKPLALGTGGFIALDQELAIAETDLDFPVLLSLLDTWQVRTDLIKAFVHEFKKHLPNEAIIHPGDDGYVVIVRFETDEEKERLINIGKVVDPTLEHTICPRSIRVLDQAVCFEVKRKFSAR